jgi:hypothetical protein
MITLTGGKLKRCRNVFVFEIWIITKDLIARGAPSQHVQYIRDTHTQAADAGPTAADLRIRCDSSEFVRHYCHLHICRRHIEVQFDSNLCEQKGSGAV